MTGANSRYSQFCERTQKLSSYLTENTVGLSYIYIINKLMQFIQNITIYM